MRLTSCRFAPAQSVPLRSKEPQGEKANSYPAELLSAGASSSFEINELPPIPPSAAATEPTHEPFFLLLWDLTESVSFPWRISSYGVAIAIASPRR